MDSNDAFIEAPTRQRREIHLASPTKGHHDRDISLILGEPTIYPRNCRCAQRE
jgi:hypothetical protein